MNWHEPALNPLYRDVLRHYGVTALPCRRIRHFGHSPPSDPGKYVGAFDSSIDAEASATQTIVQRYLEHRPVLASPPSRVYRVRKFLRRQRLATFASVAGLGFLALSSVTIWSLARRDSPPRPRPTDTRTIVLADFANATGGPGFDRALRQILATQLGNSRGSGSPRCL